jgi:hypothetical protein
MLQLSGSRSRIARTVSLVVIASACSPVYRGRRPRGGSHSGRGLCDTVSVTGWGRNDKSDRQTADNRSPLEVVSGGFGRSTDRRKHWGSGVPLPPVDSFLPATNQEVASSSLAGRTKSPNISVNWRRRSFRLVNNCEQFAADPVDRGAQRSVEHLRVHVQRGVDVGVPHDLGDDLAGHTLVV